MSDIHSVSHLLGHEIGHVITRHAMKRNSVGNNMNYVASFAALTLNVFNTGMALAGGGNLFGPNNTLSWFPRMMITSTGLGTASGYAFEYALLAPLAAFMHYQREHEMQADRIGQEISFMAGYDLEKISQGWDDFSRFNEEFYAKEFSLKQKIFMSHPSFDRRSQQLKNRQEGLRKRHEVTHLHNPFPNELKESYQQIHNFLKPYTISFARAQKMQNSDNGNTKSHIGAYNLLQHSDCLFHALFHE